MALVKFWAHGGPPERPKAPRSSLRSARTAAVGPNLVSVGEVAVLLGAGASRDAGLPTTGEMTKTLLTHFENRGYPETRRVLNFVVGQLLSVEGAQNRNPFDGVDVEKVMTAIELLGERRNLELTPFVYTWHPTVTEIEVPSHRSPWLTKDILRAISRGLSSELGDRDLEGLLSEFVRGVVGIGTSDGRVFERAFEDLRAALVEVLAKPEDTSYLAPLFDCCSPSSWLAIATLNYDLTIETEAQATNVKLDTGVEVWAESGDWQWPSDGVRLLKLHGSIDWRGEQSRDDTLSQYRISVVGPDQRLRSPAVIFGGRNKIRAEGPFLELLAQWELMLRDARTLLVVGYSFRDDHVNEVIRRWVNRGGDNRIVVVDPCHVPWQRRGESSPFTAELEIGLAGHGPLPAIPARPGGFPPARPDTPAKPQRLMVIRERARSALPAAVATAAGTNEPWELPTL